jgi:hypothetical protein
MLGSRKNQRPEKYSKMAWARQFLRRKEAPKAKMEKNTVKPASATHITIAIAMPRIFFELFLMPLLDISFVTAL